MQDYKAYLKLIEQARARIPSGASSTGDLADRVRALFSMVDDDLSKAVIEIHPGDYVRPGTDESPGISLAAPIGYDVWYLFPTANILNFDDDDRTNEILERLDPFLSKLQDIKPLKTLRNFSDLSHTSWWSWAASRDYWNNNAPYMIKEMRYETVLDGKGVKYYSKGQTEGSIGYLAFPIGQLGVMEIVSIIGESVTESDSFSSELATVIGGRMMPPVHNKRGLCDGTHLIERGYVVQDNVELMSADFEGQETWSPHRWLRHWIQPEDTFPVPGEFVSLLAKPELYHVWWFQETYPFLYSGNFFETEYYTSGTVKEVIVPDDESDEETNIYKIWIRGYEMWLRPTDFYEYAVGERVAVIKETLILLDNWDWTLLESDKNNNSSSANNPDGDWRIAPITFYE